MRKLVSFILVCALLLVGGVIGKTVLVRVADERARQIVNGLQVDDKSIDTLAIELTRQVHSRYAQVNPDIDPPLLWKLRPYLTHDLMPAVFRLPEGAIDTLYVEGWCDSAARVLGYILDSTDVQSSQLNIVNRIAGAHSVVLARFPDGREAMLDPYYGIVPMLDGELISPNRALAASKNPGFGGDIWKKLAPTSENRFYEKFEYAVFAVQNNDLDIVVQVDLVDSRSIALGRRDGDSKDVRRDSLSHGLTSYWDYLGHKYDRGWTRVLRFAQDTRVEIGLTEPVKSNFVTTNMHPRIEDKNRTLIYFVTAGESLEFTDGMAKRDWTRLKSYQDIDYIRFDGSVTDSYDSSVRRPSRILPPTRRHGRTVRTPN